MSDRAIHGYTAGGDAIVRYDRAGKWYVEPKDGKRRQVNLTEAATLAIAGRALDAYGGQAFRAKIRQMQGAARQ